jgi:hypothetical protein
MEVRSGEFSLMTCRKTCQFRVAKLRRHSPYASFDIDAYEDCFAKGSFVEHFYVIRNKLIPLLTRSSGVNFDFHVAYSRKRSPVGFSSSFRVRRSRLMTSPNS